MTDIENNEFERKRGADLADEAYIMHHDAITRSNTVPELKASMLRWIGCVHRNQSSQRETNNLLWDLLIALEARMDAAHLDETLFKVSRP